MKFQYLGTAAAEGVPAMFCECDVCRRSMAARGRNLRTRSQAVIDDRLLIDFPADTFLHVLYGGLKLPQITDCLITHSHSDHLYSPDFENRRKGFAHFEREFPLTVYGTCASQVLAEEIIRKYNLDGENRVFFQPIEPFHSYLISGYTVTPLKADHDPKTDPVFYLIESGGKSLLYANDTGYFPEETWAFLEQKKPQLNFVSLDCTAGLLEGWRSGHMSFDVNIEVRKRMESIGCVDSGCAFCVHHFSHNGMVTYDDLVLPATQKGFQVAYDGMKIQL